MLSDNLCRWTNAREREREVFDIEKDESWKQKFFSFFAAFTSVSVRKSKLLTEKDKYSAKDPYCFFPFKMRMNKKNISGSTSVNLGGNQVKWNKHQSKDNEILSLLKAEPDQWNSF